MANGPLAVPPCFSQAQQKADFPAGIPECGTDALRFALCAYTQQGCMCVFFWYQLGYGGEGRAHYFSTLHRLTTLVARDINLDVKRIVGYKLFCNKLWNALRFALPHLEATVAAPAVDAPAADTSAAAASAAADVWARWLASRLAHCVAATDRAFRAYDLPGVTATVHAFWLHDLCDIFLEQAKPLLSVPAAPAARRVGAALAAALDPALRLLTPMMPYVAEELWQRLHAHAARPLPAPSVTVAPCVA